jgi:hypothetical protein
VRRVLLGGAAVVFDELAVADADDAGGEVLQNAVVVGSAQHGGIVCLG